MDMCLSAWLRVIKTTRASMDSVERLILSTPNLKVIHLVRDPRAVLSTLKTFKTGQSLFAQNDAVKEAGWYCRRVVSDILIRRKLERKYPGIFLEVKFDEFAQNVALGAKRVSQFLNVSLPDQFQYPKPTVLERPVPAMNWQRTLTTQDLPHLSHYCQSQSVYDANEWKW